MGEMKVIQRQFSLHGYSCSVTGSLKLRDLSVVALALFPFKWPFYPTYSTPLLGFLHYLVWFSAPVLSLFTSACVSEDTGSGLSNVFSRLVCGEAQGPDNFHNFTDLLWQRENTAGTWVCCIRKDWC